MNQLLKFEEQAILSLRQLYAGFGYQPYKMSRFEEYDLYIRNKDFLVSQQTITFPGSDGRLLALKPDVTISIVKNAPVEPGEIKKLYYNESVYRAKKKTGDFQERMQAGLECVGDLGNYEIAEVVVLSAKSLALLDDNWILDISHMGLLEAVLCGISQTVKSELIAFLQQKNKHELRKFCAAENISPQAQEKLEILMDNAGVAETVLPKIEAALTTAQEQEAFSQLKQICDVLRAQGMAAQVHLDFSLGNDMRYYNGVVFRGYLQGVPEAVLSGGQYDRLPQRMGRNCKAIGFAVYLDLLEDVSSANRVDFLLLYPENADILALSKITSQLAQSGSVLAVRKMPDKISYQKCYRYENREAVEFEYNG